MLKELKDVTVHRLTNERLIGAPFASPEEVIESLVAVQAQDYSGAKWGIAQRVKSGPTDADLDKLFDDGVFLRTHVMRPTWHFVLAEDIVWLQMLTSPRVYAFNAYYLRKLGIDEKTAATGKEVMAKELAGGKHLTRPELTKKIAEAGVEAAGLRTAYIIMCAELDALVCSGVRRGKAQTYALVSERAPKARKLEREEALAELTTRYFTGHGPAQPQDFAWWSGLAMKDVTAGLDFAKSKLASQEIDGKTHWFAQTPPTILKPPVVRLLPNYDEFLIAYKDHSASFDPSVLKGISIGTRDLVLANHIVIVDGKVVGGWRRELKGKKVIIEVRLLRELSASEQQALEAQVERYDAFAGLAATVMYR
ncbi:MAG TPA: winged helix DNA-binding domain-containing protein [Magnetospirillaceae bacterium]|nr:winged helix DNA-binding domain-containing protein [Magnetospirillaceae bacterium]